MEKETIEALEGVFSITVLSAASRKVLRVIPTFTGGFGIDSVKGKAWATSFGNDRVYVYSS
jgi:DNA-binding beta-propeller fold protein YncE